MGFDMTESVQKALPLKSVKSSLNLIYHNESLIYMYGVCCLFCQPVFRFTLFWLDTQLLIGD